MVRRFAVAFRLSLRPAISSELDYRNLISKGRFNQSGAPIKIYWARVSETVCD